MELFFSCTVMFVMTYVLLLVCFGLFFLFLILSAMLQLYESFERLVCVPLSIMFLQELGSRNSYCNCNYVYTSAIYIARV